MVHNPKILSQAGTSLADVYDVEGSIAGLEELDVAEVKAVHDLGPQIHSERTLATIARGTTGAIAQNISFDFTVGAFSDVATRIFGLAVIADTAANVSRVCVSIRNPSNGREMPIWTWDSADDREQFIRWSDDGGAVATVVHLSTLVTHLPTMNTRIGLGRSMGEFVCRGQTLGFGAGTVEIFLLIHFARPALTEGITPPGEPSSHGLPIPSW